MKKKQSRIWKESKWLAVIALTGFLSGMLAPAIAAEREITLAGLQVWNVDYWKAVSMGDYMGPNYNIRTLKPISLVGCRNGVYSGSIVVTSSTAPITGLKVSVTDLAGKGGQSIPAARIRIRYPELAREDTSWNVPYRFDRILDEVPEEVQMVDMRSRGNWKPKHAGPVATERYEAMREGVQICEAILFVQRGLDTGKIPAELAARANKILDARCSHLMGAYLLADKSGRMQFNQARIAEGAFELEDELYAVAGEVARTLK